MNNYFNLKHFLFFCFYFCIFLVVLFLSTHQLSGVDYPASYANDGRAHLFFMNQYFEKGKYLAHPLWHTLVHYLSYVTLDEKVAGSIVTGFFVIFWLYVIHSIFDYFLHDKKYFKYAIYAMLLLLIVIGPAYVPFFHPYIYRGTGSPNVWHNVTLTAVKPFALITVFFAVLSLQLRSTKYYIISLVALTLSMFAKPSFAMVFIPAICFYLLLKRSYIKGNVIYISSLIGIFLVVLGYQYYNLYALSNNSKVIIDFLGVWSLFTPNVFISILLGLFFPLMYLFFRYKYIHADDMLVISWLMMVCSIVIAALLAESGPRYSHGNFMWSYHLSMSILYVFTFLNYIKEQKEIKRHQKIFLNITLCYQFYVGILYLNIILTGKYFA